jgi:flagellin
LNNISQLLDRASTLATESASGTFTGDRATLNNEYQSVLGEINRQAQSIGLNTGGTFAKNLAVFIGGGNGATGASQITNGSVSVDLSTSTVDTQSLGLAGFTAGYQVASGSPDSGLYDLSASSATSVANIIAGTAATTTTFDINGPGFSVGQGGPVAITVNLANVGDTSSLASAINAGITAAESTGTPQAGALAVANVQAVIHTGADGHQQLLFTSANSAFQVLATDATSNGLLGNLGTNVGGLATNATVTPEAVGASSSFQSGGTQQTAGAVFTALAGNATPGDEDSEVLTFVANNSDGAPQKLAVTLDGGTAGLTIAGALTTINTALQQTGNAALQSIVATTDTGVTATGKIFFSSNNTSPFEVSIGQTTNGLGAGLPATGFTANQNTIAQSAVVGTGATSDISTIADAANAVGALAESVTILGNAQAAVGRGENLFNYATNLAQSQLTNDETAESGIRDANEATEAANLTKAQILLQAGVAALAQANAAPQNILTLLKG